MDVRGQTLTDTRRGSTGDVNQRPDEQEDYTPGEHPSTGRRSNVSVTMQVSVSHQVDCVFLPNVVGEKTRKMVKLSRNVAERSRITAGRSAAELE